ncbi:unnamed protein product [Tuber melanosporum]|uniref:DNA polymerase epsilon subunit B n=1 Tax=Tuber melanosporum (strain Mel28) TaxID=656061 RepID=D5GM03_TUBMM|nr:uncharacterized protein GSTUM_00010342001 [Tuber melanosporum]CAZ85465.1 unnamed protein product [Tuber melanosporum]
MPLDKGKSKLPTFFRPKFPWATPNPSSQQTSDPYEPLPQSTRPQTPRILAVEIPLNVLRPVAFRVFTKKHNLTLKSDALALLCSFVGRRCGAEWRDSGAGEKLLDEVARQWRRNEGANGVLVDGGEGLKSVIRGLEVGGDSVGLSREKSFDITEVPSSALYGGGAGMDDIAAAADAGELEDVEPCAYLKVIDAFSQPKFAYNPLKKQFEKAPKPSLLPPPQTKTQLFRTRYNLLHQRLLRTETFQLPTFSAASSSAAKAVNRLTPISNLLGRSGQSFLLFGMLGVSPSGLLILLDPSGEIVLDLSIATAIPEDGSWFTPGCFCILDGAFEETGKFTVFTVGQPCAERRATSVEVFGHVDFLGNGVTLDMSVSSGGQQGRILRKAEKSLEHVKYLFIGEVELDGKGTLRALRKVFSEYETEPPLVVVLMGNFCSVAMGSSGGSVGYKEYFDQLASLLQDFPTLTSSSTFIFVPGDNDPWASTFSGGASTTLPRKPIPEIFTTRIKRVFTQSRGPNSAIWASNPCRIGYFTQEIVMCRDDIFSRFQRNAINFKKSDHPMEDALSQPEATGDEGEEIDIKTKNTKVSYPHSPSPLDRFYGIIGILLAFTRYLVLQLVLADPRMQPSAITYESCHVMNPGKLVQRRMARWVEYSPSIGKGKVCEAGF